MTSRLLTLQCAGFRAAFTDTGSLVSLQPEFRRTSFLDLRRTTPPSPFHIVRRPFARRRGGTAYAPAQFAIRTAAAGPERLVFQGATSDGSLAVTQVAERTPSGALQWSLRVENRRGDPVWLVAFPVLEGLSLGAGQRVTIPLNSGFSLDPRKLDDDESILLSYPVPASMQWLDVYRAAEGLYLGVHDPVPYLKQLAVSKPNGRLAVQWRYPDVALQPGESWDVPAATIDLHRGDWRAGADRYRAWAEGWIRFPDPPRWFASLPAWSWLTGRPNRAPAPERRFSQLPSAVSLLHKQMGVPVVQLAGWMEHGHDTHYPDYVAGDSMGGPADLSRSIDDIHWGGARLALYTNGRLIDPDGSVGSLPGWQRFCVRLKPCARETARASAGTFTRRDRWDPAGDMARERYGRTLFAVACPAADPWRNLFVDRVVSILRSHPVDGFFVDQVSGAASLPCYAPDHGHLRPNMAWRGYRELLATLRDAVKRLRPHAYLSTEGVNDFFGAFFDAQQSHNDWKARVDGKADDLCELFRYTFPDSLTLIGPITPGRDEYLRLGFAVAGGFDCVPAFPDRTSPEFLSLMRRTLALRRRFAPHIRCARPLAMVSADRRALRLFALEGRRHVLVTGAWLGRGAPRRATVRFRPCNGVRFRTAELWAPGPAPHPWLESAGILSFDLPPAEIFAALFRR